MKQDLYSYYIKARKWDPTEIWVMGIKSPLTEYELLLDLNAYILNIPSIWEIKIKQNSIFTTAWQK